MLRIYIIGKFAKLTQIIHSIAAALGHNYASIIYLLCIMLQPYLLICIVISAVILGCTIIHWRASTNYGIILVSFSISTYTESITQVYKH